VLEVSGTKLRLVLKFEGSTAKLGSPDQTADEFPVVVGTLDQQVPANAFALAAARRAAGHTNTELAILPGINHQLQPARTGAIAEYAEIEETIAERMLETVTAWLRRAPTSP